MPNEPYLKTDTVIDNESDATAQLVNSLMAEVKAAVEGIPTHKVDMTYAYEGGSASDLLSEISISDTGTSDEQFGIGCTITYTYDANDRLATVATVFTNLGVTVTESYTYTGDNLTGVTRILT